MSKPDHTPSPPQWHGARALAQVQQLNERCLDHAVDVPRALRKMVVRFPLCIVDLHWQNEHWWTMVCNPGARHDSQAPLSPFGRQAGRLTREVLFLAWHVAIMDPRVAMQLFGMSLAVAASIGRLESPDIERIASRHHAHLQLRWERHPKFLQALLWAAGKGDTKYLHALAFHSLRMAS